MAPDPALITARGWELIDGLPPILREDPDLRALMHCHAKETERQEETLAELRAQLIPTTATSLGLPWWEVLVHAELNPVGLTDEQRRELVTAYIRSLAEVLSRFGWEAVLDGILGPGWTYEEHDPGDPGSPPLHTIRVTLPFPPSSTIYQQAERVIRQYTDAHIDLILQFSEGFVLDESQLDQEGLG